MPLEYEYTFRKYDKNNVIKKLKKIGAKKFGHFIFRVIIFQHPDKSNDSYIRIRDEGHKITLTIKTKSKNTQFSNENEIIIDNFDVAEKMLYLLGCTKKYHYEKMREIWKLKNSEIIFDIAPGITEMMEIESPTKKILDSIVGEL
jgi:adenylate cyclase class 2